jgi:hypothetical protein
MHRIGTDLAGYSAIRISGKLKPGYRIFTEAGYRISGRIFVLTLKCLIKYEINKKKLF